MPSHLEIIIASNNYFKQSGTILLNVYKFHIEDLSKSLNRK